jgi:hypothetical protein
MANRNIPAPTGKTVPSTASTVPGVILVILHLWRLLEKVKLANADKLHPGYPSVGKGYDEMLLKLLEKMGVGRSSVLAYIQANMPAPITFELWLKAQIGNNLNLAAIAKFNGEVLGFVHSDEDRIAILTLIGAPLDTPLFLAIQLNALEDAFLAGIEAGIIKALPVTQTELPLEQPAGAATPKDPTEVLPGTENDVPVTPAPASTPTAPVTGSGEEDASGGQPK